VLRGVLRWLPWPVGALFSGTGATPGGVPLGRYQMVALLPRIDAPLTAALALAVLAAAGLSVGVTFLGGAVVGAVPGAVRDGLDSAAGRRALLALAATGAAAVVAGIVGQVRVVLATALGQRLELHLEERVMRAVGRPAGIAHLEDAAVLDRIALAQEVGTAGDRPALALLALANLAPKWLRSAAFVAVLAQFSGWLAAGVFVAWYGAGYLERRATVRAAQAVIEQARLLRRSNYLRDLVLTPTAAKEVRIFGLTGWLVGRFRAAWLGAMADVWRTRRLTTGPLLVAVALLAAALVAVGVALGGAALRGEIGPGALAVYLAAALGVGGFFGLVPDDRALLYGAAAVPAVFDLERRTAAAAPPAPGARAPAAGLPRRGVRFEGVSFRYPGAAADVLTGVDLELPAGRSLALVGENGAGKTTLV
jgi:ABC-type multidrug transport system fused ATPase/permease subunit